VQHADGTHEVIVTNQSWRMHAGPWLPGPLRNSEGDHVEHIDARLDPVGWDKPGFDDRSWLQPIVLGPHPTAPFLHLRAARTHIVEHIVAPRTLRPLSGGAYVADFGSIIAATPVVTLHHGVSGRAVTVVAGDLLDPNGHVSTTHGTQETDMHWDYDERAGVQVFRPFDYLGFRYLEVDGSAETLTASDVQVSARHAAMPDEQATTLTTSNATINAVWNLAVHSALYDTQEQVLDTPTREKGAFMNALGDSTASMLAFRERAVTAEALGDFATSQARYWPDGRVNVVYPNGDGGRDIPDSTEGFVEWVWRAYMVNGDRDQLASLYPVLRNISDYVARSIDHRTGLVTNLPGGTGDYTGGIVDWPPHMRYGYDVSTAARTTVNILAVDVFRRVAAIGEALHAPGARVRTENARAAQVATAIHRRLARPSGVLVDGLEANGRPSTHASQLANAMALEYGLIPKAQVHAVAGYVVSRGNAVGVPTFEDLLAGLHAGGRDDAFRRALTDPTRPGYAQILSEGATFTWEAWDARQTGDSESHGFGAAVIPVLVQDVLGVSMAEPGAARLDVHVPAMGSMAAHGTIATQRGPVKVSWQRSGRTTTLALTIPANVTATVHLPGRSALTIGSGSYSYRVNA
jgi:alpha-L-rhamnosidase